LKLYEHEAKTILKNYAVPTPNGKTATTSQQTRQAAEKLKCPVAVKAQVFVAGRGKAGGIQFADSPDQAEEAAQKLFETKIKNTVVKQVLVEEKLAIKKELYFAINIDRLNRCYIAMASQTGGVDIEQLAEQFPEKIVKKPIKPHLGFRIFHARQIAKKLGYSGNQMQTLSEILEKIYRAAMDHDAQLIETNPLAETADGNFVAADARIIIDDNALYRHPIYQRKQLEEQRDLNVQEYEALKNGLDFVKLDGDIGVVGNGAGLVMATLDMIAFYGGKPANFLDLGGGSTTEKIKIALEIVLSNPQVKAAFVNILGGITHCDDVAHAIVEVKKKNPNQKPIVVRLVGTKEQEGKQILANAAIQTFDSMEQAAQKAVDFAKEAP
jgi:succinyl-CoA synthetase beta subunit